MNGRVLAGVRDVSHAYARSCALDDVTLRVPAGCMLGLIGPDGVGKSTLLSLIAGVRRIQQGEIEVLGADLRSARARREVCPRIAYMPQGLGGNLYASLSVRENIEFFARLFELSRSESRDRIVELLDATGLAPFADRLAAKLSGGMRQKLGLCCALIHDPELLILDEPTTGIDPLARRQFWELIGRIRERNPAIGVLVATAYMEEAERFDRLAMLGGGRILATGRPEELRSRTGAATLEEAYVHLLPEDSGRDHSLLSIPPFEARDHEPAIETRNLTKRFGDFTAVDRVSFRIERGEIFGFIGSNGCGKTTTMKMITGLLPSDGGEAFLFGRPVDGRDLGTRRRVGYMSQSFSLYGELSVRQNLALHARLFDLPAERVAEQIETLTSRFGLQDYEAVIATELPLGIRQRLSLAVAIIHEPEVLILDEPTSGVDPIARDAFWTLLGELSRDQGMTIFISTHFMNEAARCDRIALMHAGRVLACAPPRDLVREREASDLESAFVSILEEACLPEDAEAAVRPVPQRMGPARPAPSASPSRFRLRRLWAYAHREFLELQRDPVRISFALLGPMLLLAVLGFGVSLDIEEVPYAVLDHDRTPQSRGYLERFEGSRTFRQVESVSSIAELERALQLDRIKLGIEIPPNFGRDLLRGRGPEVAAWIDGAVPFRGETIRNYVQGVHQAYLDELADLGLFEAPPQLLRIETRFRYNQEFKSTEAIVPGILAVLMVLIPAILTALGVVREKELGSITNFYATPVTRFEFLLGKQLPYVGLALLGFAGLVVMSITLFEIPLRGGIGSLLSAALLYVLATTGLGLLVSAFVRSQIGALVATLVLTMTPAINFSGLLVPTSSLTGAGWFMGSAYPITYFLQTSVGGFTKGLGFAELHANHLILAGFVLLYWLASAALLPEQER